MNIRHSLMLMLLTAPLMADHADKHQNVGGDRLAIQGYDPVSYTMPSGPQKGDAKLTAEHRGAIYRFVSAAHRDQFAASPDKYAPAFGGWCATAMADGRKVEIDPKNFKIVNGRLMLFYRSFFANALKDWNADEAKLLPKADAAWSKLVAH
jgi:hypothetical protein